MSAASLPVWLFVSYGGGHVKALLPVAERVRDLGLAQPVYLALTTAAPIVRASGIETIGFRDLLTPADVRAREKGEALAATLEVQAADQEESVAYLGLSSADLEERLGAAEAASQYARYGRQAFLPLGVLERAIARWKPGLVIATNSPRAERAAIEVARKRGVPAVCLLDLLGLWEKQLLARHDYADAICVINEGVRRSIVEAGRPARDVHVTGNPAFDTILAPAMREAGAALRREAGWDGLHVLLYASSPEPVSIPDVEGTGDPAFPRRVEAALVEAVQADPRLALWIRRHPSEAPPDDIAALRHPRIRVSGREMPLHACLHACDEVLVTVSTVGVEADIAGKYVTQVRGSILDSLSPYVELGIARREVTLDGIPALYGRAAPLAAAAVSSHQGQPGRAVDKVVEVLRLVAEHRHG